MNIARITASVVFAAAMAAPAMAEDVASTLRMVFQKAGGLNPEESEDFLMQLRVRTLLFY